MSGSPVIIVTGASKGLGLATVKILLSYKARVLGVGRSSPSAITQLQSLLSSNPDLFKYISLDVTDVDAAKKTVQSAIDHFGRLDSIVHNAGVLEPLQRIADADLNEWRRCMDVNLYAGIQLIQMGLPHLRKAKGRFILVSSGAATGPKEGWVPYCVAKAASNMLVAGLGLEEKEVVSIALRPGVVDTDMQTLIRETGREAMGEASHDRFVKLKNDGNLLHPDVPGHVIAKLGLEAPKDLSGQFISWDDARLAQFRQP